VIAARRPAVRDEGRSTVLSALLRRVLRRILRQLRRTHRRRPGPNVARGSALARDRGLLLLRYLPRFPPGPAVLAATWCHLLQHSVQQGGTADDTERLLRRSAATPAVLPQVGSITTQIHSAYRLLHAATGSWGERGGRVAFIVPASVAVKRGRGSRADSCAKIIAAGERNVPRLHERALRRFRLGDLALHSEKLLRRR
jgi:hypothetical protein